MTNRLKFKHILFCLMLLPLLAGCADDDWLGVDRDDLNGELPVEFTFEWPGITETRGFDDATVKIKFSDEDVIHVVGTFETKALQEDGSYKEGKLSRYGALKYEAATRSWKPASGSTLTWPSIATRGKFYAYYISSSTGLIYNFDEPIEVNLSSVTPETDPLMAPETDYMDYGHAVNLQFGHLCTYLTLYDLEPMVASQYFFTTQGVYKSDETTQMEFNNAFKLTKVRNDGKEDPALKDYPALKFEFFTQPDANYPDDQNIYVAGNAATMEMGNEGEDPKLVTRVGYFLEPGFYKTFDLSYPTAPGETAKYLKYDYDAIPPNMGGIDYDKIPPNLKAGHTYTLTITKSPGITIVNPPSGEGWADEEISVEIDVKEFLEAVRNAKEYINKEGTKILEAEPNGVKLLHNVDFKFKNYEDFMEVLTFLPDVNQGKTFDGNLHYIDNLGCPLFRNNYGTIKNLGIRTAKINTESVEYSYNTGEGEVDNTQDRSRHGALCMWNRPNALIENVRVSNVDMTVNVKYNNEEEDGNEVHNIGGIVGSNTGKISDLYLGGHNNLTVNGENVGNASVLIGGIAGQIAGSGTLAEVSLLDQSYSMKIINTCTSDLGLYAIGGIVGKSSGFINGVILQDVVIDSRKSSGLVSYIGGMAGQLEVIGALSSGSMSSCIVSGTVSAGVSKTNNMMSGRSYTGGMVGFDDKVPVTGCRASVSVIGTRSNAPDDTLYGTGGAFGRIFSPSTFDNLIAYGAQLISPAVNSTNGTNYIGSFAGIIPGGQTWDADYAGHNIITNTFNNIDYVGTSLSD